MGQLQQSSTLEVWKGFLKFSFSIVVSVNTIIFQSGKHSMTVVALAFKRHLQLFDNFFLEKLECNKAWYQCIVIRTKVITYGLYNCTQLCVSCSLLTAFVLCSVLWRA